MGFLPARLGHTGYHPLVGQFTKTDSTHFKLSQIAPRTPAYFAAVVTVRFVLWCSFRLSDERLFCHPHLLPEIRSTCWTGAWRPSGLSAVRHSESFEQLACLIIRFCTGTDHNIHTMNLLYLVIIDFRENDLLLYPDCKIPPSIE